MVLLLLFLAAAPTWEHNQAFALTGSEKLHKMLADAFRLNAQTSTDVAAELLDKVRNTLFCMPVSERRAEMYIKSLKLYFYYGPTKKHSHAVPLSKASSLLQHPLWRRDLPLTMYVFGWTNNVATNTTLDMVRGYHSSGQHNLVVVDWHVPGRTWYGVATTMVPRLGKALADALQVMLDAGARLGVIVGQSLGAQLAAHTARNLREKPPFLAGLDPSGPLFSPTMFKCQDGMSPADAKHVVVIHSDWNRFGVNEVIGHVDFMPNNGHGSQPGCPFYERKHRRPCSHDRASRLWEEAIRSNGSVLGRKCISWIQFKSGQCSSNSLLSPTEITNDHGLFFLTTNSDSPYGKGLDGV